MKGYKMKYFKELENDIRTFYCELMPPTIYYQGDTFEDYTEEDLEADIKTLENFIDYLDSHNGRCEYADVDEYDVFD